jgi:hypothetical protein
MKKMLNGRLTTRHWSDGWQQGIEDDEKEAQVEIREAEARRRRLQRDETSSRQLSGAESEDDGNDSSVRYFRPSMFN